MKVIHKYFKNSEIEQVGTKFLLGNGHLGYRGTLEEFKAECKVGLTIAGAYDQYANAWREPINAPNPFYTLVKVNNKPLDILKNSPVKHEQTLNMLEGTFTRRSEYLEAIIDSTRFVDRNVDEALSMVYQITAKEDIVLEVFTGLDTEVWDLNGPHLYIERIDNGKSVSYFAKTNEEKFLGVEVAIRSENIPFVCDFRNNVIGKTAKLSLKAGEKVSFSTQCIIEFGNDAQVVKTKAKEGLTNYTSLSFLKRLEEHKLAWANDWDDAFITLKGDKRAQHALTYSIYHLLILTPRKYRTSIAARGLSGQTYKGAVFWDTEIFLLPFFTLTNPSIAKELVSYRVDTLVGALKKASDFGYKGAFYAWESQENGREACSLYNIHDAKTGEPVRTHFADRQIHISADVAYGALMYLKRTGDINILTSEFYQMLIEIMEFYHSYANLEDDGYYHFNQVIGPDEYHELVDDNAFTNYMIYQVGKEICELVAKNNPILTKAYDLSKITNFVNKIYLPKPNKEGVIEQFKGYFALEDIKPNKLHLRKESEFEYLGGPSGIATKTRVIKQADVVTLLVLLPEIFSNQVRKANYDYYEPYTEHGSSLSACMYAILGLQTGGEHQAYNLFLASAEVDLTMKAKRYAGGTYIGGSHPASAGGAYLATILGFAGMNFTNEVSFKPKLVNPIKEIAFKYYEQGKQYAVVINSEEVIRRIIK